MTARPGIAAALLVLALTLGSLAIVALRADAPGALGPADRAAIRFTIWQALVSATLSVALAIPLARALARRRFPGRGLLVLLLGAPFILPIIVAVLGLLAIFGTNGLVSTALAALGLPRLDIYGAHGVILAHVFFNLPLATRLILHGWLAIPAERFRLAASLDFGSRDIARLLERPMLREVVPGTFAVIFLICLTSFAVALTLGGGPRATTVELAIYQAFRLDFDLGKAALLSLVQMTICVVAAAAALGVSVPQAAGGGFDRVVRRVDADRPAARAGDAALIALASAFLLAPLGAVVANGIGAVTELSASVWIAGARSVVVALASAALTIVLGLAIAVAATFLPGRAGQAVEGTGYLAIAASPLVIGTGLFILLNPIIRPDTLALPVTALVNAAMSLPFVLRALVPATGSVEARFGRLADSLDLTGWARLRWVILPRLRRPLGFSAGLAAALSMGDLGVVALFAQPAEGTLPLAMYGLMAAYRMDAAAGAALVLLAASLTLFWVFDRGGRVDADT